MRKRALDTKIQSAFNITRWCQQQAACVLGMSPAICCRLLARRCRLRALQGHSYPIAALMQRHEPDFKATLLHLHVILLRLTMHSIDMSIDIHTTFGCCAGAHRPQPAGLQAAAAAEEGCQVGRRRQGPQEVSWSHDLCADSALACCKHRRAVDVEVRQGRLPGSQP